MAESYQLSPSGVESAADKTESEYNRTVLRGLVFVVFGYAVYNIAAGAVFVSNPPTQICALTDQGNAGIWVIIFGVIGVVLALMLAACVNAFHNKSNGLYLFTILWWLFYSVTGFVSGWITYELMDRSCSSVVTGTILTQAVLCTLFNPLTLFVLFLMYHGMYATVQFTWTTLRDFSRGLCV